MTFLVDTRTNPELFFTRKNDPQNGPYTDFTFDAKKPVTYRFWLPPSLAGHPLYSIPDFWVLTIRMN